MPNIHELVNNVAAQISNNSAGEVWFTNLDLKNAYSQLSLDNFTSSQCNFSLVGGDITGTYQFLTGFYGLGDMPNEFQRVMDSISIVTISKLNGRNANFSKKKSDGSALKYRNPESPHYSINSRQLKTFQFQKL